MTTPRGTEPGTSEEQTPQPPKDAPTTALPSSFPSDPRPAWTQSPAEPSTTGWTQRPTSPRDEATTVLPAPSAAGRPPPRRPIPPRPAVRPEGRPAAAPTRPSTGRTRRARLSLRRIDPWSVFLFSLVASVFLGIALIVAVAVLYAALGWLGVNESLNQLFAEVTGGSPTDEALLTAGRIIGGATVVAAINVVFLTLLATLGAMLYNLCASFTGGIELTLGERD